MSINSNNNINHQMGMNLDSIIESIPLSYFHYRLLLLCGLVFMADGMEVNLLTYMSTCAGDEWNLSDSARATIVSVVFAGEMFGSLFWGPFADKFGRRIGFLAASIIICTAGFLSAASPSYGWLIAFRFLVGFGVGGAFVPFDLLTEFLPAKVRGDYLNRMQYFWTIGSLFVTGLAWIALSNYGWRFLTYMTAVPVTLSCLVSLYYLPESPRWLLVKGRDEEATNEVKKVALCSNVSADNINLSQAHVEHPAEDPSYFELFRTPSSRRVILPLGATWLIFGFTYYGIILFVSRLFSTDSSDDDSNTCSFQYTDVFINATAEFVGVFICILMIDPLGRSKTQSVLYFTGAIAVALMGVRMPGAAVLTVGYFGRLSVMGASSATWVATPELLPTELRGTGHSFCNTMARVGGFCTPYLVLNYSNSIATVGLTLGVCNLLAAYFSYIVPETAGLSLDVAAARSSIQSVDSRSSDISPVLKGLRVSGDNSASLLKHLDSDVNGLM